MSTPASLHACASSEYLFFTSSAVIPTLSEFSAIFNSSSLKFERVGLLNIASIFSDVCAALSVEESV